MSYGDTDPTFYPRVSIDYLLGESERQYLPQLERAGAEYAASREPEERFMVQSKEGDRYYFISFGKTIIRAMSYADMGHQTDVMQADIERLAGLDKNEALLESIRAGQMMVGSLPDPE